MKRIRILVAALAVLAVLAPLGVVDADEGVFLGYGFSEGHEQGYKVKFNQELDFGGYAFSQIVDMEVVEKCVGVEDSLFVMEMHFDKVESARMQSDNIVDDPMGERLTGNTVTFKVDKFGETSEMAPVGYIDGWDRMQKVVEAIVDNWYAYLPNKNVTAGETWARDEEPEEEGGLTIDSESSYEFKEIKKEKGRACAKIEGRSKNTIAGQQETQIGTMNVDGNGKGEAEFYFCMDSSTIIKYKAKYEVKMDMTPEAGGDATGTTVNIALEREVK
jgi:hypothetical protein